MNETTLMVYAPIAIHTYTRLEHLQRTIEALLQNDIANQTDLYIASDAPRLPADENKVILVRNYINKIKGFRSVNIVLREKNYGFHLNAQTTLNEIFKKYDRVVILEDDIIVGKGFLRYINEGLSLYNDDKNVFAICGYLDKSISINHPANAILLKSYSPWGFGIWRNRFVEIPDPIKIGKKFLKNPYLFIKMNLNNPNLVLGLLKLAKGKIFAVDLAVLLHMIENDKKCLFPTQSLVINTGNDGSGEHCIEDRSYENQSYNQNELVTIEKNKALHNYCHNPYFSSIDAWILLLFNLFKFFLIIFFGEKNFERIRLIKNNFKKFL